jgi:hypothetical protein
MLISHLPVLPLEMIYSDQSPIDALAWSAKHIEKRVPVIDRVTNHLIGTIHEDHLLRYVADATLPTQYLEVSLMAYTDQHVFDVLFKLIQSRQHTIPVIERNGLIKTFVDVDQLRDALIQSLGLYRDGITILVETDETGFELQTIIGILEREGIRIMSLSVEYPDPEHDEDVLRLNIRIEPVHADRGISSLRRFGYAVHADTRSHDDAEWVDRAEALLRYLDL